MRLKDLFDDQARWRLTSSGHFRHAYEGRKEGSACGIPAVRLTLEARLPLFDGLYHCVCQRCAGKLIRRAELESLEAKAEVAGIRAV